MVEGTDDCHTVIHLTSHDGLDWDAPYEWMPHVHNCGGYTEVLAAAPVAFKTYSRLGIIVDANGSTGRHMDILGKAMPNTAKIPLPSDGLVLNPSNGPQRLGIWVMPDNVQQGRLEDFLATLVPKPDWRWSHAEQCLSQVQARGFCNSPDAAPKALLHTWLSWQDNPGLPYGTAIKSNVFDTNHSLALRFNTWFRRVFE